jgi:hypothetical protein
MLKVLQLLLCAILFATPTFAQDKKFKAKYGKISDEELAIKTYKDDSGAPALILFDRAELSNRYNSQQGFIFELERHVRIKIFNKDAYSLADVAIPYYYDEKIIDLKASSYNLENGVLVETKLDKDNVFDEKLMRSYKVKKLTIPAVREGTIIEYKYTRSNMNFGVPDWVFQDLEIPKLWSEYKASVPSFIEYRKTSRGEVPFSLAKEEEQATNAGGFTYQCHEMHFIQENIPALKPEPYVNSIRDYLSQINFDIGTIYRPRLEASGGAYGSRLVNGAPIETYTWENLGKELLEDTYDNFLSSTKYTEDETATSIVGKVATADKVTALYEYIGKNYQSKSFDIIGLTETIENITKHRKGTPTELNLLLINMLRRAKVNAFPVAISTLENGYVIPYRVTVEAFDRILTVIENDDKTLTVIDAAAWPHPLGFLPEEDLNNEGLLLRDKENISWIPLQNKGLVRSAVQAELAMNTDGKLTGTVTFSETGYGAVTARTRIKDKDAPTYLREKFPDLFTDGSFTNLTIENLENWQEPNIKGSFGFEATGFSNVSGNKIYLNPSLGFGWKENPFKNPIRKFNIELGVPRTNVYSFVYTIPKGYKVEEAPKGAKMTFGENGLIFEYFTDLTPESIKITIRRSIRQPYILVEHYADLQQFYGNIVSKLEEQVVLTKI